MVLDKGRNSFQNNRAQCRQTPSCSACSEPMDLEDITENLDHDQFSLWKPQYGGTFKFYVLIAAVGIQRCIWHVYPFSVLGRNINLSFGQIIACTRSVVLDPYNFLPGTVQKAYSRVRASHLSSLMSLNAYFENCDS